METTKIKIDDNIVEVEDQGETVDIKTTGPIYVGKNTTKFCQTSIPCHWYKYKDPSGKVQPFVGFYNNDLCFFANSKSDLNQESLDVYSSSLLNMFATLPFFSSYGNLALRNLSFLAVPTKSGEEEVYRLVFKIGKNFTYEITPSSLNIQDFPTLTITSDGSLSKTQSTIAFLKNKYLDEYKQEIYSTIKNMNLEDCVEEIIFEEPNNANWFDFENDEKVRYHTPGVLGTSYKLKEISNSKYLDGVQRNKCVLFLSPAYFLYPKYFRQKLLVHELSHIYCGVDHGHDSYFWSVYEQYAPIQLYESKANRKGDIAYSEEEEQEDNEYYNKYLAKHGMIVERWIQEEKQLQKELQGWHKI